MSRNDPLKTDMAHQVADTVVDLAEIVVVTADHLPVVAEGIMTKVCHTRVYLIKIDY